MFVCSQYLHACKAAPSTPYNATFFLSFFLLSLCVCKSRICFSARHRALPARLAICMDDSRSLLTSAEDALPINNVKDVGTRCLQ